ncbi:hypothetical protein BB560_001265 [Smittium megazygosporum]|uniref:H/ACA ribonucleoprotein complex subunit n=1 Tax=Smittium megazygosporum TaxID=133381 RepID=A0A2T9ZI33_9FUNG|nr:hypothetical protein BB560_001265 [Smittium megazygosporum]
MGPVGFGNRGGNRGSGRPSFGRGGSGGARGGFSRGGRGGSRGSFGGDRGARGGSSYGPPESVVELGTVMHDCEGEMVCKSSIEKVPYFNAPVFLQNKSQIGKVDEIFGPINQVCFSIKMDSGIVASSFEKDSKVYISPDRLLPLERFLPKPKSTDNKVIKKRTADRGSRGGRGRPDGFGRGGGRGGFGATGGNRGGSRGFFGGGRGGGRGSFGGDRGGRGGSRGSFGGDRGGRGGSRGSFGGDRGGRGGSRGSFGGGRGGFNNRGQGQITRF